MSARLIHIWFSLTALAFSGTDAFAQKKPAYEQKPVFLGSYVGPHPFLDGNVEMRFSNGQLTYHKFPGYPAWKDHRIAFVYGSPIEWYYKVYSEQMNRTGEKREIYRILCGPGEVKKFILISTNGTSISMAQKSSGK